MKTLIISFSILVGLTTLHGQTKYFFAKADGTIDRNSYREIVQSSGMVVTHDKTTDFKSDTAKNFRLFALGNKIKCEFKKTEKTKNINVPTGELGILTDDKKIIDFAVPLNGERTPSAYVRDSKIYSLDNKLLGFIEGSEIYGVGLYLLHE